MNTDYPNGYKGLPLAQARQEWQRLKERAAELRKRQIEERRRLSSAPEGGTGVAPTAGQSPDSYATRDNLLLMQDELAGLDAELGQLTGLLAHRSKTDVAAHIRLATEQRGKRGAAQRSTGVQWLAAREALIEGLPERLAALAAEVGGVRALARQTGISYSYISRLIAGQRPTDAPLQALVTAYPEMFDDVAEILRHAPSAARGVGRPLASQTVPGGPAGRPGAATTLQEILLGQFALGETGRLKRVPNAFSAIMDRFVRAGARFAMVIDCDRYQPNYDPGDVAFIGLGEDVSHGDTVLAQFGRDRYSLRLVREQPGQTVLEPLRRDEEPTDISAAASISPVLGIVGPDRARPGRSSRGRRG